MTTTPQTRTEADQPKSKPATMTASDYIGEPGGEVRAFAFAGGGFDAVIQMGVVHALVVSEQRAPDVVLGISAGAVNAATLAEILQAGQGLSGDAAREAQVTRFRKILNEHQEAPGNLLSSLTPDPYEINARRPLRPLQLPVHRTAERIERERALRVRAGLIRLFNGILRIRISFGTVTRAVRHVLGLHEAAEIRNPLQRLNFKFRHVGGLAWLLVKNLHHLTPPLWLIERRVVMHRLLSLLESGAHEDASDCDSWLQHSCRWLLAKLRPKGDGTREIILPHPLLRLWRPAVWLAGLVFAAVPWVLLAVAVAAVLIRGVIARLLGMGRADRPRQRSVAHQLLHAFLSSYEVARDLGDSHLLRQLYVRVFDPDYYGTAKMDDIVESALAFDYARPTRCGAMLPQSRATKKLANYREAAPSIQVLAVAADVATGKLVALPESTSVVDALMAATAVVPIFRAVRLDQTTYIDGLNVANQPALTLVELLRQRLHPQVNKITIYSVSPFPLSKNGLRGSQDKYTSLLDVVFRAIQLRRYRDAKLERRLINLYRKTIPSGNAVVTVSTDQFVGATLTPIDVDQSLALNERILHAATNDDRRRMVLEAVADGCRATIEATMQPAIQAHARAVHTEAGKLERLAPCWGVLKTTALVANGGPGVPEVCEVCAVYRDAATEQKQQRRMLRVKSASADPSTDCRLDPPADWPRARDVGGHTIPGDQRPLVSLLFSGGVFRGVFQFGVLNALNELNLRPDIVAGSSVGSITAAFVAQVYCQPDADQRRKQIARLCATFLGLDRLILTDRFADFVRRFTLRAAEAKFSPHDLDDVFRRYDAGDAVEFNSRVRRVVAGLERLFYVSPYELNELVKAFRLQRTDKVTQLLKDYVQELLDRHGVGFEALGSEPLTLLIQEHIFGALPELPRRMTHSLPFDVFDQYGIRLLAMTTNLKAGRLDTLGDRGAFLVDGLLASSAFPGVFRPRWSWEVYNGASAESQFIDGGIMDNLPLDAVVRELDHSGPKIARRPQPNGQAVPHLLFAASLEVNVPDLMPDQLQDVADSWFQAWRRSRRLSYNHKLDAFARAQRDLRRVHDSCSPVGSSGWKPLDVEVVAVKPAWLCGTFAMHPMLGFRRQKQAASIAHGCASTLARFAHTKREWANAWGIEDEVLDKFDGDSARHDPETAQIVLNPQTKKRKQGDCWFRVNTPCPFSRDQLTHRELPETTQRELEQIYHACGRPETHRPA